MTQDSGAIYRKAEALLRLAIDQRGKPEGQNALSKALRLAHTNPIPEDALSAHAVDAARQLGVPLQLAMTHQRGEWTVGHERPQPFREPERPRCPDGPHRHEGWTFNFPPRGCTNHEGFYAKAKPRRVVVQFGTGPFKSEGHCPQCNRDFVRYSEHAGYPPSFCSEDCRTASRREQARQRMARNRAASAGRP